MGCVKSLDLRNRGHRMSCAHWGASIRGGIRDMGSYKGRMFANEAEDAGIG